MSTDSPSTAETVAALLSRGGVCLGLAAAARAHGASSHDICFAALAPGLSRAVTKILAHLEATRDFAAVSTALELAMNPVPSNRVPAWTSPFSAEPARIDHIGQQLNPEWPPHARKHCRTPRQAGLACLAIALCRSIDSAEAFARTLPLADAETLRPMLSLAAVCVHPGDPGSMKKKIQEIVRAHTEE